MRRDLFDAASRNEENRNFVKRYYTDAMEIVKQRVFDNGLENLFFLTAIDGRTCIPPVICVGFIQSKQHFILVLREK